MVPASRNFISKKANKFSVRLLSSLLVLMFIVSCCVTASADSELAEISEENSTDAIVADDGDLSSDESAESADEVTAGQSGTSIAQDDVDLYVILDSSASLKAQENEASLTLGYISKGSIISYISESADYYLVQVEGIQGYISKHSAVVGNAYVNDDANMRMSMDTSSKTIKVLKYNTTITVLSEYYEWCKIEYNGKEGYVHTSLVTHIYAPYYSFTETDKVCTVNRQTFVYSEPKETYYSVKEVFVGESLTYESADKDWVKTEDGYIKTSCLVDGNAYVSSDIFLTEDGTNNSVIVTIPAYSNISVITDGDVESLISYKGSIGYLDSSAVVYYVPTKPGNVIESNATVIVDGISLLSEKGLVETRLFAGDRVYFDKEKDGKAYVSFEGINGYIESNTYMIDDKYNLSYMHTIDSTDFYSTSKADDILKHLEKGTVGYFMSYDDSGKYVKSIINGQVGYIPAELVKLGNGIVNSDAACYYFESASENTGIALEESVNIIDMAEEEDFYTISVDGKPAKISKGYVFVITENYNYQPNLTKQLTKKAKLEDENGKLITEIKKGKKVTILEIREDNVKVLYENSIGLIDINCVKLYCSGKTTQEINLMSSVGEDAKVLTVIPIDAEISIDYEYDDLWSRVIYNKKPGYVLSCFIQRTNREDYTWHEEGGYKFAYDINGNKLRNSSDLVDGPYKIIAYVGNGQNTVVVYSADEDGVFNIPCRIMTCSPGATTPRGTFFVPVQYRWLQMEGDTFAQWCTDIIGDYLFHTVPDYTRNAFDLEVDEFNQLGTTRSLGCIRLLCSDAKYLFDTMEQGQEVTITDNACPFEQPESYVIDWGHRWDPSDYDAHYACIENGCH